MVINIYTDGSCHNKCQYGVGAWAYCLVDPDNEERLIGYNSGVSYQASSNLMEMKAVSKALEVCEGLKGFELRIHSDSAYVVNCFLQDWYSRWEIQDYMGVKNAETWKNLISQVREMRRNGVLIEFVKVKGHAGNRYNELVDKLAGETRQNEITKIKQGTSFIYRAKKEIETYCW